MAVDLSRTCARIHYDFLDGVRAVAVSLVVFFHFDLLGLPGGFFGVDMFFVISGFLVGDLILRNIAAGNFSVLRFFERRIYRILPALYVSLILMLLAGYFLLLPTDYAQTAVSVRASALLFANIYFHDTIEYFNQGSQFWMLLHHWSLSVEEQFYLIFPFALILLTSLRVPLKKAIPVLLLAAFLYSFWLSARAPSAAFYLVQARLWEFLAGVYIAVLPRTPKLPLRTAELISVAALAVILLCAKYVSEPSELNRLVTAVPVAATALLIWANINVGDTRIARMLSAGWIRKIGLISYSMYILHWPFILFAQYWAVEPLGLNARLIILAVMIGASWLSWRYIEQPFRKIASMDVAARRTAIVLIAATTAVIVFAATWIIDNKGFEASQPAAVTAALAGAKDFSPDRARCHSHEMTRAIPADKACVLGAKTSPSIVVWSDSHGVELAHALARAVTPQNRAVLQMSSSSCPPILRFVPPMIPKCAQKNDQILAFLKQKPAIRFVVMAMSNTYFQSRHPPQLLHTIRSMRAAGKTVILIKPFPRAPFNVPHAKARKAYFGKTADIGTIDRIQHHNATATITSQISALKPDAKLIIIDPADDFCDSSRCNLSVDDRMFYFDDNHPSLFGANLIAKRIAKLLPPPAQ